MQNITVHRYANPETQKFWQGYIEPDDLSWIAFVDAKGHVSLFDDRDPVTGAVISERGEDGQPVAFYHEIDPAIDPEGH